MVWVAYKYKFMNICKIDQDKKELNKHVSIIHCSNSLSLLQRKISNVLLFHAYRLLLEQEEHKISIKELCNYLGYRGGNQDAIKQALKVLISTVIEWDLTEDSSKEENWTASSILASVNIKGPICTYSYSSHMKKLLYNPSMYGKINLFIQSSFTSSYGLALYENCIRYKNLSQTKVFSMELFRKLMGVPNDKYLIFRDFKKRVIDKAVDEINSLSDITVAPKMSKIGCKVIGISFDIVEREKKRKFTNHIANEDKNINEHCCGIQRQSEIKEEMIRVFQISNKKADDLIGTYGISKIEEKIEQIKLMPIFISGKIGNFAGLLIDALKNDYLPSKSSQNLAYEKAREKERVEHIERMKIKKIDEIKKKYDEYLDDQLLKIIKNFDQHFSNEIRGRFVSYLLDTSNMFVLDSFKTTEFSSRIVRAIFRGFLKDYYSEILKNLHSFEEFQRTHNSDTL